MGRPLFYACHVVSCRLSIQMGTCYPLLRFLSPRVRGLWGIDGWEMDAVHCAVKVQHRRLGVNVHTDQLRDQAFAVDLIRRRGLFLLTLSMTCRPKDAYAMDIREDCERYRVMRCVAPMLYDVLVSSSLRYQWRC